MSLLVLCTGNAARSVMAGLMLEHLAVRRGVEMTVTTAGTHAVDGLPVGARTLAALRTIPEMATAPGDTAGPPAPRGSGVHGHRSSQLGDHHVRHAGLVVAMEAMHVRHVRRTHPEAAARTATLRWLARELEPG
ncbi:MAG TPA: hypothetical protein VMD28_05110, partial [Acidimicrobiales bacterium]|nr:hypothetical protein [Acidimicrobiales bacterium]